MTHLLRHQLVMQVSIFRELIFDLYLSFSAPSILLHDGTKLSLSNWSA